ncbi:hypothetical protein HAX54_024562 [Datura stramonium]|uniref:Uncharacterized protein n=1 Tax=Datura stramonium TaxID=4076 RepID=A0ABS8V0S0_DATST|nr:hypothetical protein [Datura stramonium]
MDFLTQAPDRYCPTLVHTTWGCLQPDRLYILRREASKKKGPEAMASSNHCLNRSHLADNVISTYLQKGPHITAEPDTAHVEAQPATRTTDATSSELDPPESEPSTSALHTASTETHRPTAARRAPAAMFLLSRENFKNMEKDDEIDDEGLGDDVDQMTSIPMAVQVQLARQISLMDMLFRTHIDPAKTPREEDDKTNKEGIRDDVDQMTSIQWMRLPKSN